MSFNCHRPSIRWLAAAALAAGVGAAYAATGFAVTPQQEKLIVPGMSTDLRARVVWMHQRPLQPGRKYFLKHSTQTVQAIVSAVEGRIDIQTFDVQPEPGELAMNDIGKSQRRRRNKRVQLDDAPEREQTEKTKHSSARARSAAAGKAARTRARPIA